MSGIEPPFISRTGRVLSDAEIEALADEAERGYEVDPARAIAVGARRIWCGLPNRRGAMTVLRIDVLNRRVLVKWDDRTTDWLDFTQYHDETESTDA